MIPFTARTHATQLKPSLICGSIFLSLLPFDVFVFSFILDVYLSRRSAGGRMDWYCVYTGRPRGWALLTEGVENVERGTVMIAESCGGQCRRAFWASYLH